MSEIGPFKALMLLCSYEERMKETINPKKLENGELKLSDLLTEEDFVMVHSVSTVLLVYLFFQFACNYFDDALSQYCGSITATG